MAFVTNIGDEETAANMVEEAIDPTSPSPALAPPSDDGLAVPAAGSVSQSSEPSHALDWNFSREQVAAGLQPHLAAAENRVSKALQQVMESMEAQLLGALRQAAIDIVDNLGKEAAACLVLSERKAAVLVHQLNYTKQQALSMLMRLKQVTDAQISDAERQILIERRRAQEAEAKLFTAQESNKRLRAELKRKGQLLEEFQRVYPTSAQQGLEVGFTDASESRKGDSRLKGSTGQKHPHQAASETVISAMEPVIPAISSGVTTFGCSVNIVLEEQTENINTQPPIYSLATGDGCTATKIQMGMPAIEVPQPEKSNLQPKEHQLLTVSGPWTVKELHGQQESPANESASVRGPDNISGMVHQPYSVSKVPNADIDQVANSLSLREKGQLSSSLKGDSEVRSTKDSDEEKSCLTIEALYCNDESIPTQLHLVEEYQSDVNQVGMELQTSDRPKHQISDGQKHGHETDVSIHCTEQLDMDEDLERARETLSNSARTPKTNKVNDKEPRNKVDEKFVANTKEGRKGCGFPGRSQVLDRVGLENGDGRDIEDTVTVAEKAVLKTMLASPLLTNSNSDASLANLPVVKPLANHSASSISNEDAYQPETQNESPGNQVSRRKRKQGVLVSKYEYLVADRSSKRLEDEGAVAGAFDLLATAGVDAHISSRDSRRLMQGARQLFSLAERKWR